MTKVVVRLDIHDKKDKEKAMKAVSSVSGSDSISVNMNDKTITVIGDADPVKIVQKLRKTWHVEIISVGPDKEPEKKKPEKKEPEKKDAEKKNINTITNEIEQAAIECMKFNNAYYGYMRQPCTCCVEGNPNYCVIC